jgi:sulfide:quinone oxidoreductase
MVRDDRQRVLVAGGGVGGVEALLAIQALAGDRVTVDLLAPDRHFTHRPLSVVAPFRAERPARIRLAAIAADRGVRLHRDAVARVDSDARVVHTQDGAVLPYDALVLALGARPVEAVRGALTFRGPRDAHRVRAVVDDLEAEFARRVAFVVPPGTTWSLPAYELALQTAHSVPRAQVHLVTGEEMPLAAFGAAASDEVAELLAERGVTLHTGMALTEFDGLQLWSNAGWSLSTDRVIALPQLEGPHVRGLPADPAGFVPVDDFTRVLDADGVHAVGDIAAHGIKQGGLAAQQADVAAQVIAARAGVDVEPSPYRPVLRAMLITGADVRYLRHDPSGRSEVSDELMWWPPHKVAGRELANYFASHTELARV